MPSPLKIYFTCFMQFCFVAGIFAGTADKFVIGIDEGPGISFLYNKPNPGNPNTISYYAAPAFSEGINFQYNINKTFSVRTGAYYNLVNVKEWHPDSYFATAIENQVSNKTNYFHLNYLTIPVLFRTSFGKKTNFFLEAGPYVSTLANPVSTYTYNNVDFGTEKFNLLDAGIVFGAGVNVPLPCHFGLNFEVRNDLGLVNAIGNLKTMSSVLLSGFTYTFGKDAAAKK